MLTIKVPMLFLGLLLTAAFIAACGDSNSTQEDNKEVVQRFAEEFKNQANHGIVDELMTPGFIHHFTDPRLPPGRDAMKLLSGSQLSPDSPTFELLSNLVEIPFQANCRSVRRSRHPVDLAML